MFYRLTLVEECLATCPANQEIFSDFVAANAPDAATREEEIAEMGKEKYEEKQMTVFPRENGRPFIWDYQIKGFFKRACGALNKIEGYESAKIRAFKKIISDQIFVRPRKIFFNPENIEIGICQRPLRGQTAQGERIALAKSETIPAGSWIDIEVVCLNGAHEILIPEWFNYGQYGALLQWRNSGKGAIKWGMISKQEEKVK